MSATEWAAWTVEAVIKEDDFRTWAPSLDALALPAPASGEAWPTDALRKISTDYGRSHFIFCGDDDTAGHGPLQRQQHLLYPTSVKANPPTKADRVAYLTELCGPAAAEAWASECDLVSPSRNRVVARVKFELLARWLQAQDARLSGEAGRRAALYLMFFSTQGPLAYVKRVAQASVPAELCEPLKAAFFSCWRAYVHREGDDVTLRVSFRNYRPTEGVWQVAYPIRECDHKWELEFSISGLRRVGEAADWGRLVVRCKAEAVAPFTQEERSQYYGVWWPAASTVVRYCDTCPTF